MQNIRDVLEKHQVGIYFLAVPDAIPLLPAIIVTQTLV